MDLFEKWRCKILGARSTRKEDSARPFFHVVFLNSTHDELTKRETTRSLIKNPESREKEVMASHGVKNVIRKYSFVSAGKDTAL